MSDSNGSSSILAFLLGGVIGAGAAMLYTPRTGRENREELGRALERLKGQAVMREKRMELRMFRAVDDITNRIIDILSEGKDISESRKEELLQAIADAKRQLQTEAGVVGSSTQS